MNNLIDEIKKLDTYEILYLLDEINYSFKIEIQHCSDFSGRVMDFLSVKRRGNHE